MAGKCPKCDQFITQGKLEALPIQQSDGTIWEGVACLCPHCSVILSMAIDPVAIKTSTIEAILDHQT